MYNESPFGKLLQNYNYERTALIIIILLLLTEKPRTG